MAYKLLCYCRCTVLFRSCRLSMVSLCRLSIRYSYVCEDGCGVQCKMPCTVLPPRSPEPVIVGPPTRKTDNQRDHAPSGDFTFLHNMCEYLNNLHACIYVGYI